MIKSVLRLDRADIKTLQITDSYSLHRVVYSLYEDIRTESEKAGNTPSGILYADKGGDKDARTILLLSNRAPRYVDYGQIESKPIPEHYLDHTHYDFEVIVNPTKRDKHTGKLVAIRGHELIAQWFTAHAEKSWGFSVNPYSLQIQKISVNSFIKKNHQVTQGNATIIGSLTVLDRNQFIQSFQQGIGRGRAFGCGLLQIVPTFNSFNF